MNKMLNKKNEKNNLKSLFILMGFVAVILLSLNIISAYACVITTSCSSPNHVVMRLSETGNAHGELASQSNYNNVLCCDFGNGDTSCNAENKVLGLSSPTNAHAERPENSNYANPVCYNSLDNCSAVDSTTPLDSNDVNVIWLSDLTNAHLGGSSSPYTKKVICDVNVTTTAPQVCGNNIIESPETCDDGNLNDGDGCSSTCQNETISSTPNAYWSNSPIGSEVSSITIQLEESVFLKGRNLSDYNDLDLFLMIYERDAPILGNPDDLIKQDTVLPSGGNIDVSWQINQTYLDLTGESQEGGPDNFDEFYFELIYYDPIADQDVLVATSNDLILSIDRVAIGECDFISFCDDYDTQSSCNVDACSVGEDSAPSEWPNGDPIDCSDPNTDCGCGWNSTVEPEICESNVTIFNEGNVCGDGEVGPGEQCDDGDLVNSDGCSALCVLEEPLSCDNDNTAETGELCDGTDLNDQTCGSLGFDGGTLACDACGFNVSGCFNEIGFCGDKIIQNGETCDPYGATNPPNASAFNSLICQNFDDFTGGTLNCSDNCQIETNQCAGGIPCTGPDCCGNGVINIGETCDPGATDLFNGLRCQNFDDFTGGELKCDSQTCLILTNQCTGGTANGPGSCQITQNTTDDCSDGFLSFSWDGSWLGSLIEPQKTQCEAGGSTVNPCPAQIQLPFFSIYNIVAIIVLTILIYFIISKRKKSGKVSKKKR